MFYRLRRRFDLVQRYRHLDYPIDLVQPVSIHNTLTKVARFQRARQTYSLVQRCRQLLCGQPGDDREITAPSLLSEINIDEFLKRLNFDGAAEGLQVSDSVVEAIHKFAESELCYDPDKRENNCYYHETKGNGSSLVQRLYLSDPSRCDAIQHIAHEPKLYEVASRYLGYRPKATPTLMWSLARCGIGESSDKGEHCYDAARFHFDTEGFNSVQAIIFLTDVDAQSGAHLVIRTSHRNKPLSMTLRSSVNSTHERLRDQFGASAEKLIFGRRGSGFMEDPSCFHRVIHPTRSDRLALRILFS